MPKFNYAVADWKRSWGDGPGDPWTEAVPIGEDSLRYFTGALSAEVLLYGMHVILFGMCVHALVQRNPRRTQGILRKIMLVAVTVSFILATADTGVTISIGTRDVDKLVHGNNTLWVIRRIYPKFVIHLVNNFIADVLLIIRFYAVWGHKKRWAAVPGFILVVGTGFGIYSEGIPNHNPIFIWVYIVIIFAMNLVLTVLIAGKIFWISWKAKKILGPQWVTQYNIVAAILMETGFFYSAAIIVQLIISQTKYVLVASVIVVRMVCITPVLIIVQVALGRAVEDLQTTLAMAEAARARTSTIILDTVITTGIASSHRQELDEDVAVEESQNEAKPEGERHTYTM